MPERPLEKVTIPLQGSARMIVHARPLWSRFVATSLYLVLLLAGPRGYCDVGADDVGRGSIPFGGVVPDIREEESRLTFQDGDFVAVPIPISNPTVGNGLVVGSAYFYPQTPEQEALQPASLTGIAGMYTSNASRALVLAQQNYWGGDRWRFTGAGGAMDVRLNLRTEDETSSGQRLDWQVKGAFLLARILRRLSGDWYGGAYLRVIDAEQRIDFGDDEEEESRLAPGVYDRSAGIGLTAEYDSRDLPTNAYAGRYFKIEALDNDTRYGSTNDYRSGAVQFNSYHSLADDIVLAFDAQGCARTGDVPLWDACRIPLRGFAAFDYLGERSASLQGEARWRMKGRWGLVAFAGGGTADAPEGVIEENVVPSYGVGLRFEVLPAKRINVRLDYARSDGRDAVYFSVGEAF